MASSTSQQRHAWADYDCNPDAMAVVAFGPDRIRVAPPTAEAWRALAQVMQAHGYQVRVDDTDSYCCREIKGGGGKSLHCFGIALDVNWHTNPFKLIPDGGPVRHSARATQAERAADVKHGHADTDMTEAMVRDVLAIRTGNGKRVFEWGGSWQSRKDTMHFEIDVAPADLLTGIDGATVRRPDPGAMAGPDRGVLTEADDMASLTLGAQGDPVTALQGALQAHGSPGLRVDGEFGPLTQAALREFQRAAGLEPTGEADPATFRALGLAAPASRPGLGGGGSVAGPDPMLEMILRLLQERQPAPPQQPAPGAAASVLGDLLRNAIAAALTRAQGAGQGTAPGTPVLPAPSSPTGTLPPVLSPVDKALGGEALTGKKTVLAVLAYAVFAILQAVGVAGPATGPAATPTAQILTTLIGAFGGLGVIGKVDRVIQVLGLIAARRRPAG